MKYINGKNNFEKEKKWKKEYENPDKLLKMQKIIKFL